MPSRLSPSCGRSRCCRVRVRTSLQPAKEIGTTEQTFYRWRKEYGGLNVDQAKRLKQLEDENGRLKKLVADLSLEKQVLRDIAQGKL